jgi:hypothetical protein
VNLREELPWEVVVISGLVLSAVGLVWNYVAGRRPQKPDSRFPDLPGATGGHRTSYVMMLVGLLWAGYGVLLGIGL